MIYTFSSSAVQISGALDQTFNHVLKFYSVRVRELLVAVYAKPELYTFGLTE